MAPSFKKRSSSSHPPSQRTEPTKPTEALSKTSLDSSPTLHSHTAPSFIPTHGRSATSPAAFLSVVDEDSTSNVEKALNDSLGNILELGILWKRKTVLSLDGGGVRGLCSLYILRRLMSTVREMEESHGTLYSAQSLLPDNDVDSKEKRCSESRLKGVFLPCHYFDYITGTSTGGIIALMLGRLQFTIEEAIISYKDLWGWMAENSSYNRMLSFKKGKYSNSQNFEMALENIFKSQSQLLTLGSDPRMCRTFVLAMETGEKGFQAPYLFRSYPFVKGGMTEFNLNPKEDTESYRIVDVCRAVSASSQQSIKLQSKPEKSTKPIKIRDGSRWTMNPSLEAYREIHSMHFDVKTPIHYLLSVGCGVKTKRSGLIKVFSPRNSFPTGTNWEDIATEEMMRDKSLQSEFGYCRLAGPEVLPGPDQNDRKSNPKGEQSFQKIENAVNKYCDAYMDKIEACARALVSLRRRRAKTSRWEEFAFGYKYKCQDPSCAEGIPLFDHRADFVDHLRRAHEGPPETEEELPELEKIISKSRTMALCRPAAAKCSI
ncbi:FabD/lysophospholipase-like protein [Glonium stellatum]|uniref:FabD/lysophospholipase-like protein n=1 Tax=Glonium stellatum TaxID=574774 RepID=A0A8E2JXI4_9PEZI|nr:FabD/lysophospholipase-like protein [Glonium stellatum]